MHTISQLYIYPVKSLGGFAVPSALLTDRGLQYDRRWMLVDENNRFLTQREYPVMALLQTAIEKDELIIFHKHDPTVRLQLPLVPETAPAITVTVWDDSCEAQYGGREADDWFSRQLSTPCRLVYMPEHAIRPVDAAYSFNNEMTSFSDGYPLLMIGDESLKELNSRLADPLPMNRFRPNIVFTGGKAYDEDLMEQFVINDISFHGVKLCARCPITSTDQDTAIRYKEPLRTLASYRMLNNKVYFGQNVLYNQAGHLKSGDRIKVEKWGQPRPFNGR